jgi:formate dehydrogenase iron-sulfur subunit
LSGVPAGDYTLPTTRYVSSESLGPADSAARAPIMRLIAADSATLHPQSAHWPLVFMLVLSQASVGITCVAAFARDSFQFLTLALALGVVSIIASIFHLGRPLGAWRFFLGLRRSWLSREILMFSVFVPVLMTLVGLAVFFPHPSPLPGGEGVPQPVPSRASAILNDHTLESVRMPSAIFRLLRGESWGEGERTLRTSSATIFAKIAPAFLGLAGVFCSMMIYHDTRRALWHWRRTAISFFGTTLALGCSAWLALYSVNAFVLSALLLTVALKLAREVSVLRHVTDGELTSLKKSALLITGHFQHAAFIRMLCAVIGGIGLPLLLQIGAFASGQTVLAWIAFAVLLAGGILERMLFFRCVDAPKMPGGLPA